MNTRIFICLVCAFLLMMFAAFAYSGTTGKISGRVLDAETGEGLPGVNVTLVGSNYGAATDTDGYYRIINASPGNYSLKYSMIGYSVLTVNNIIVNIDRTTTQNVKLAIQVIEGETIVISAERPLIERDRTNSAAYVDAETIDQLPVQEVSEIISLQAGVVTGAGGEMHFRGGREREVAYLIDGMSVSNSFSQSGGSNVAIENAMIKELQVISGTFNAEYGSAQSGIINVVTKNPAKEFHGQAEFFAGDFVSNHTDRFIGVNKFDAFNEYDLQTTLSGPLFHNSLGFFATARFNKDDGYLNGERRYNAQDGWAIDAYRHWFTQRYSGQVTELGRIPVPDELKTGDMAVVPMSPNERFSFTGKVNFIPTPSMGLTYTLIASKSEGQGYANSWRYAPDGLTTGYGDTHHHFLSFRHNPNPDMFYNFRVSSQYNHSKYYLDEVIKVAEFPGDSGVLPLGASDDQTGFVQGNNSWGRGYTDRNVLMVNGDINWQIDKYNFIKVGFEVRQHDIHFNSQPLVESDLWKSYKYTNSISGKGLDYDEYWDLMVDYWRNWSDSYNSPKLRLAKNTDGSYIDYDRNPIEASAYIQDKVELGELVMNFGLRMDVFDPSANTLVQKRTLSNDIGNDDNLKAAELKKQISPRVGFSFPISDQGAFHVSYGHFFQIPSFQKLFERPVDETMTPLLLDGAKLGDPDLLPEKTIAYEIGLQQQISNQFAVDLTLYYKDIRNQLGLEAVKTVDAVGYTRYVNRDYGNVKGFTLAFEKLRTGLLAGGIDYTFQYAKGSASSPDFLQLIEVATRLSGESVQFPERQILALEWDQRHTVNLNMSLAKSGDWSIALIGKLGSGLPYSPSSVEELQLPDTEFKNSARKPYTYNLDIKANKQLEFGKLKYSVFFRIYNLFDRLNENSVYAVTGRATENARLPGDQDIALQMLRQGGQFTMAEWDNRPQWFSRPRQVQIGLSVRF
jgi:outer membrane receptor protein involved in Fe transport